MIKICVVTTTRAEYGLLKPLLNRLRDHKDFNLQLVVTGTHLSNDFGMTRDEIEKDGFDIASQIAILDASLSRTMARALEGFDSFFLDNRPEAVIVLGDRYETLAIACAATNARIPIVHLYGGDTTEGAIDEAYRHSITKMSQLHFVSCEDSRRRVIQLGEDPDRVFNVGALAVENAFEEPLMTIDELEVDTGLRLKQGYAVVTFHPVTLEDGTAEKQCKELLAAISSRTDLAFIITKSNADDGGDDINKVLDDFGEDKPNVYVTASLGMRRYLSAVKYAKMVIGNSSSGIYEAPLFATPTVNIGDRQRGRLQAKSIINCEPLKDSILAAMETAEDENFLQELTDMNLPYGDGHTSEKIMRILEKKLIRNDIDLKKKFYDLHVN